MGEHSKRPFGVWIYAPKCQPNGLPPSVTITIIVIIILSEREVETAEKLVFPWLDA